MPSRKRSQKEAKNVPGNQSPPMPNRKESRSEREKHEERRRSE